MLINYLKSVIVQTFGRLAQLVEQPVYTGKVAGSSPASPTKKEISRRDFNLAKRPHNPDNAHRDLPESLQPPCYYADNLPESR
jgi:hypothetical protein